MLQQFSKDIRLHKSGLFTLLGMLMIAFLFGVILVAVIMYTDDDPGSWFCMGTLMACLVLVACSLFLTAFSYPQEFMLALSMGRTRKAFMASYCLRLFLQLLVGWLLVLVLYQIELKSYTLMYFRYQNEVLFSFLTNWKVLLPIFILLPILSMFLGALYGKYGKKGLFFFYVLWMLCCFVLPRMFHDEPSEGVLDQMAFGLMRTVQVVPVGAWIGFGVFAAIGMTCATVKLGMEQMVK